MELYGIPGAVLVQGGAALVLTLTVLLILSGKLVPRKTLEDVRADRDARLKERDELIAAERARGDQWQAAAMAQDQRNDVLARQIDLLLDGTRTTNALIEGLKQASQEKRL